VLVLQPEPGVDAIRSLRWALKGLLRRHGMKCVDIHEQKDINEASSSPPKGRKDVSLVTSTEGA
jgi:hypothetical protein